ncbi:DUF2786 domain-containing protein [Actinoplanes sp. NPDC051494]|uniref:DUF2786 domain-containing protein n=1 Tax=Actinoplanes sp. NPDC051494 TaxID=3363907 RepID=UPI00378B1833
MSGPGPWPRGGAWIIAGTSPGVDWQVAAAALAAAASVRVALVLVGPAPEAVRAELRKRVATWVDVRDGGSSPAPAQETGAREAGPREAGAREAGAREAGALVSALLTGHGLVLVASAVGFAAPVGRGGWTLTDLARGLGAPAIVVTGGPGAVEDTTLAVTALGAHGVATAVLTVGDDEGYADLPVPPAGRIPAVLPPDVAAVAWQWLDPMLRAGAGVPAPAHGKAHRRTPGRRRMLITLAGIAVVLVLAAAGLTIVGLGLSRTFIVQGIIPGSAEPVPEVTVAPRTAAPTRPSREACPRNAAGVTPARADAATVARVGAAWQRIEDWLAGHAPVTRRTLRAPAPAELVERTQRRMSVSFPADLVASLRRHDGATGAGAGAGFTLPPFFQLIGAGEIVAEWALTCQVLGNAPDSGVERWWDRGYVPFATFVGGGYLVVDRTTGGNGRVGEFDPEEGTRFEGWPGSLAELLEKTATALETGHPYENRYRPVVTAGALDWEIVRPGHYAGPVKSVRETVTAVVGGRLGYEDGLDVLTVAPAAEVDPVLAGMLFDGAARLLGRGWQPAELHRVVARRGDPAWAHLAVDAIAAHLRGFKVKNVDPRWRAQTDELGAKPWWGADNEYLTQVLRHRRTDRVTLIDAVLGVLRVFAVLPSIETLVPPPGQVAAPARTAGSEAMLTRVRALLAKAESTTFPAEAEAYSAKAQELISRHSLDEALIGAAGDTVVTPYARRIGLDHPYESEKASLLSAVAGANRCQVVWSPEFGFATLFGFDADLDAVDLLHASLLVQAHRAMARAEPPGGKAGRGRLKTFRQSFLVGYAVRIGERLGEAARAALAEADDRTALVPVLRSREVQVVEAREKAFPRTVRGRGFRVDNEEGWESGRDAADAATLS